MNEFSFDLEKLGAARFIGKIAELREMTAKEFDELRGASLSERIGPERKIMFLAVEDLQSGRVRATFFTPPTSPVSKWTRFVQALNQLGVKPRNPQELVGKVFEWEERREEIRPGYSTSNILIPIRIPSTEEIAELENRKEEILAALEGEPAAIDDDIIWQTVQDVIDGKTHPELVEALKDLGFDENDIKQANKVIRKKVGEGSLRIENGRYRKA